MSLLSLHSKAGVGYQEESSESTVCDSRLALAQSTDIKYYALPDRLYLVGRDGRIAYRGAPSPFGFIAAELGQAIERYLAEEG